MTKGFAKAGFILSTPNSVSQLRRKMKVAVPSPICAFRVVIVPSLECGHSRL